MVDQQQTASAPPDAEAARAWTEILRLAAQHALVVFANGQVLTLVTPEEQRRSGMRQRVLDLHHMREAEPCAW